MPHSMQAVAITPKRRGTGRLLKMMRPEPRPTEVLVRTIRAGIDGTDRELNAGLFGEPPADSEHLVIGHESLGRIVEVGSEVEGLQTGDLVVPTVRRPCLENCPNCARGSYDACSTGHFRERGIRGLHGYLAQYYVDEAPFLVKVPPELADIAVLLEPLSIVEKIISEAFNIQRRIVWTPRRALVLGAGCVGLLATMLLRLLGFDTVTLDRAPESHLKACIARETGSIYLRHGETSLRSLAGGLGGTPDLIIEATGFSQYTFEAIPLLGINGVIAICGISGGTRQIHIPADAWNMHLVLGNRVMFGSANSSAPHFQQGIAHMRQIQQEWPGVLQRMMTRRLRLEDFAEALGGEPADGIKTVIELEP